MIDSISAIELDLARLSMIFLFRMILSGGLVKRARMVCPGKEMMSSDSVFIPKSLINVSIVAAF